MQTTWRRGSASPILTCKTAISIRRERMTLNPDQATRRLILVPAIITLVVTLLRLTGELQGWSPRLFSPEPGGGGALFGIWLLVPVFGVYFALKLARAGQAPQSGWRVALRAIISLAVIAGIIALTLSVVGELEPDCLDPDSRCPGSGCGCLSDEEDLARFVLDTRLIRTGCANSRSGHHVLRDHGQLGDALRQPVPGLP